MKQVDYSNPSSLDPATRFGNTNPQGDILLTPSQPHKGRKGLLIVIVVVLVVLILASIIFLASKMHSEMIAGALNLFNSGDWTKWLG